MKSSLLTHLLDCTSPRRCTICTRRLSANESVVCASCHLHLPHTHFWLTPYDNPMARLLWGQVPLAGGQGEERPNNVERVAALFFYEPHAPASKAIYDLKYHGRRSIGPAMGHVAAKTMAASGFFDGIDIIVPIPLTRRRQWQRGYNQSTEIAKGVSLETGIPIGHDIVKRTSFSRSQTQLQAWERKSNVENVFTLLAPGKARGRHILIVDDIMTTGATAGSCARLLCKAGDVRISVLTLGFTKH